MNGWPGTSLVSEPVTIVSAPRLSFRPEWSFVGSDLILPGGVYEWVHSSLCAIFVSGHMGACTCTPVFRHRGALHREGTV